MNDQTETLQSLTEKISRLEQKLAEQQLVNAHLFIMISSFYLQNEANTFLNMTQPANQSEAQIQEWRTSNAERMVMNNKRYRDSFDTVKSLIWRDEN
tara:strand:- start:664 stop:954 length:291 start_codon:yes stop_codon:yes gene_type:complete